MYTTRHDLTDYWYKILFWCSMQKKWLVCNNYLVTSLKNKLPLVRVQTCSWPLDYCLSMKEHYWPNEATGRKQQDEWFRLSCTARRPMARANATLYCSQYDNGGKCQNWLMLHFNGESGGCSIRQRYSSLRAYLGAGQRFYCSGAPSEHKTQNKIDKIRNLQLKQAQNTSVF